MTFYEFLCKRDENGEIVEVTSKAYSLNTTIETPKSYPTSIKLRTLFLKRKARYPFLISNRKDDGLFYEWLC